MKHIDVEIPLGVFVCVTGVSGSGKSSLVNDILVEALRRDLNGGLGEPGAYAGFEGLQYLDKLIAIDQSPIGRTPRSNPGTYIKVFDDIRNLFAQLPESKRRGYKPGRFSFNVARGRCEACEGNGSNRLEMDFLADVWVTCPVCEGHRYNHETRQVKFKGKSIADVLEMDVQQALQLFENIPNVCHKLQTLHDVGLDYVKLGQPSPTLSGGEAQRIKLARELVKRSTGKTLYLLDEPTTGLHFADIQLLLKVLHNFVDSGNTVLVVEHNLDVVKTADWIIDLGPEGGDAGGYIVTAGTPEQVARCPASFTGQALAEVLSNGARRKRAASSQIARAGRRPTAVSTKLRVQGAQQHNLKSVSTDIERDQMTVFCGPSGSGKIVARDGHDLCRRTTAICGEPQRLRPAVRQPDAETTRRSHRRLVTRDRDRAEESRPHAAFHRGDRHGSLRLPAHSAGPTGDPTLSRNAMCRSARRRRTRSRRKSCKLPRARASI